MQRRQLQICALIAFLLMPAALYGQSSSEKEQLRYQRALQEIDGVLLDTGKLDDPLTMVSIKSRAASLIWSFDRKRSQVLFLDLWQYIDQQRSESFNKDEARTVLLKNLYPINSGLASRLLRELSERQHEEATLGAQATGNDPGLRRLANISAGLVNQDPTIAARLLEQSLAMGVTPTALSVISRLRERNPILANYVVSQTLEHLRTRPTIVAFTGLHLLTAYVFPAEPLLTDSPEAGESDDQLRFQYFSTAYEILKSSLEETDAMLTKEKRYTAQDLRFRAIYQGQIALILAALAPRFAPQFAEELSMLATRLSGSAPANVANLSRFIVARLTGDQKSSDNPDTAIAVAIANRDFDEARRLIDKIDEEEKKKAYTQILAKAEFKALISEANLTEAFNVGRRIDNVNLRVLLLLQLARVAYRKDDITLTRLVLSEARSALTTPEKDGLRARVLLSFASEVSSISESDAIDMLHTAVAMINSLPKPTNVADSSSQSLTELALSEVNDPIGFVDSPDLQRAFSSVGLVDFDGTLIAAGRLNPMPVQLMARLATSEIALTRRVKKSRVVPEKKISPAAPTKRV